METKDDDEMDVEEDEGKNHFELNVHMVPNILEK